MMEEYPERLIEKLKLEWMLLQCGPYKYKDKVFEFYVEKKGLEVLLEELKESLSVVIKNQVVFGSDQSVFFVLNVIETIRKQKKMAKTTEDKEKINKTEQECFTMLRNAKNLNQYPMWFFITADYWYRKEKMLAKDMAEILFFIYFYWDETMLEDKWFGDWQSCLSKKELKGYINRTLEIMNRLIEEGKLEPSRYFISLELEEERPNRKRIGRVMDRVNQELNQTIEQTDNRASFLTFLLLQDSPVLVEKAWKKGFLTERNLQNAVKFAVDNEKKEILPSLYQCIGKCDNKPDSYML